MGLRSAHLTGDPVLGQCFAGAHRMLAGERGLSVFRVQRALLALGRTVGPAGADGIFGSDTGSAVTAYKTDKGLQPNDPVIGVGTARALDDDLFVDPPTLDPTFAEFSPFVVDHRLEQFAALELVQLLHAPLDSWRHMLGRFALDALNSGLLLGMVAGSRGIDLRIPFLAMADPMQIDPDTEQPITAEQFFDEALDAVGLALTVTFTVGGARRCFILLGDEVVMGRGAVVRTSDQTRAPATLQGAVVHELTHARNLDNIAALLATDDTDASVFVDVPLAQARTAATQRRSARTLRSYVAELSARHVHWAVLQELAGTPGTIAAGFLSGDELAAAAMLYFVELATIYDVNGYGAGINAQGDARRFPQLEIWLRLCAQQSFSSDPAADQASTLAFHAAADDCANRLTNPSLEFAQEDGVFPLMQDFS